MMLTLTDWAIKKTGKLHGRFSSFCCSTQVITRHASEHEPKMWDNLKGNFINHLDEINRDLKAAGLPELGKVN